MKKQIIIGIIGFILVYLFIVISGCGSGSSTINPGPFPTSNPTSIPTSQIPTATPWPVGNLTVHTNMPGKWIVMQAFFQSGKVTSSDLIESDYNPHQEQALDGSGNAVFNNIPLNSNVVIQIYNDSNKNTLLASTNTNFTGITTVNLNQNEITPTPTGVIAIPTPLPGEPTYTPTTIPPLPTNTVPAGATNTPTPTATNTASPTPTNTVPAGNPSITSVTNAATGGSLAKDGDTLTIVGTNLGSSQGTVSINGTNASITSWNSTTIVCTVTTGSFKTNGPIVPFSVTRSDSQSASFDKMVLYQLTGNPYLTFATGAPVDVTFNSSGTEFAIADQGLSQIRTYTYSTKNPLNTNNSITAPGYISNCSANNKYYVSSGGYVYSLPSDLSSSSSFGGPPTMASVMDITYNTVLGKLFCVDYPGGANSPIHQYNTDGTGHSVFLSGSTTNHPLSGLISSNNGDFYTISVDDQIINKYNSSGSNQYQWSEKNFGYFCLTSSGTYDVIFSSVLNSSNQPCISISLANNTQAFVAGKIPFIGSNGLSGPDYNNHNLLVACSNPKCIYLIQF